MMVLGQYRYRSGACSPTIFMTSAMSLARTALLVLASSWLMRLSTVGSLKFARLYWLGTACELGYWLRMRSLGSG